MMRRWRLARWGGRVEEGNGRCRIDHRVDQGHKAVGYDDERLYQLVICQNQDTAVPSLVVDYRNVVGVSAHAVSYR